MNKLEEKKILKLIKLYKENECLWNSNSKLYKKTYLKRSAFQRIAAQMQMNEREIKGKIEILRSLFKEAKQKMISSRNIEETNLFYYKKLRFLDPHIICKKPIIDFDVKL